jgi:hypothetical protein
MTSTTDQSTYENRALDRAPSGWAGWAVFAGIVMITMGAYQAIVGLVALFDDGYYVVRPSGLVVNVDYTAWGWTHLIIGLLAFFAGFGVLSGKTWARAVGITLAGVGAIVNFAFIAAFPVWGIILITMDIVIIYALAAHGRELQRV